MKSMALLGFGNGIRANSWHHVSRLRIITTWKDTQEVNGDYQISFSLYISDILSLLA